jgi:hypothetical protein
MLRDLIRQAGYRAKHRVTVLDCCYSGIAGGMSPGAPTRDDLATALDEDLKARAVRPGGKGPSAPQRPEHTGSTTTSAGLQPPPCPRKPFTGVGPLPVRSRGEFPQVRGE